MRERERERQGEKKGVGFRNGEWSGGFGEEYLRKDLYPPGGRGDESLLKMTGRPSHGDLQENCSFVKISTCVLACDLINCLLVPWRCAVH